MIITAIVFATMVKVTAAATLIQKTLNQVL